jgi:hypothetical protein
MGRLCLPGINDSAGTACPTGLSIAKCGVAGVEPSSVRPQREKHWGRRRRRPQPPHILLIGRPLPPGLHDRDIPAFARWAMLCRPRSGAPIQRLTARCPGREPPSTTRFLGPVRVGRDLRTSVSPQRCPVPSSRLCPQRYLLMFPVPWSRPVPCPVSPPARPEAVSPRQARLPAKEPRTQSAVLPAWEAMPATHSLAAVPHAVPTFDASPPG